MSRFIYNLLFPFVFLALLPGFLLRMARRGKYRHKFGQRFGVYSDRVRARLCEHDRDWVHAVSVGEVRIALKLLDRMKRDEPGLHVVLSTTTSTGFTLACAEAGGWVEVIYNPIDLIFPVRAALRRIRPRRLILVEAEVWPNLVAEAKACGIPVALVNARLSPRSERRFRKFRWLSAPVFRQLDLVCVQDERDVGVWNELGARPEAVRLAGSIKYDHGIQRGEAPEEFRQMLDAVRAPTRGPVLLGGSTHDGEEVILGRVFLQLRERFPDLFLVVVPRHFERAKVIEPKLRGLGLTVVRRSVFRPEDGAQRRADCMLVDTTGELRRWYSLADVVFVGKSLTAAGGQNPVEPVQAGKAVVVGPHMENFAGVMALLRGHHAIAEVAGEAQLAGEVGRLLGDPAAREAMGAAGCDALAVHRGATDRTVAALAELLPEPGSSM